MQKKDLGGYINKHLIQVKGPNDRKHFDSKGTSNNSKERYLYIFFFLPGSKLISIANISRIKRDVDESLEGFQRKEIKNHVRGIVDYLDEGNVLFLMQLFLL